MAGPWEQFQAPSAPSDAAPDQGAAPAGPWTQFAEKPAEPAPEVGAGEAFGRGAAQAFGLGYSPQIIAALKTGSMPGSEDPAYIRELAKQKLSTEQAWQQHPWIYGGGMVASAIPAAINAVVAGPEELAAAGTIGGLGGIGLRTLAGEGAGFVPGALRGTATALENPVVQGAIMGSAEGEDPLSKATGAAFGAVGAKVAPAILGAAGSAVKSVASKAAPEVVDPIVAALTGDVTAAQKAGDLAAKAGMPLPGGAVSESKVLQPLAMKADFTGMLPAAASETLSKAGEKIANFAGDADRKATGAAIRDAVQNWATDAENPTGFAAQLNKLYEPVRSLEQSSAVVPIRKLQDAVVQQSKSPLARISNAGLNPTLDITNAALSLNAQNGGLSFAEMQALKKLLSDTIDWNQAPGSSGINNNILKNLRAALGEDMQTYAEKVGGKDLAKAYSQINSQAENLYKQRESIFKLTGNPIANAPGSRDADAIFNDIINSAAKKGGKDPANLANLQQAVSQYAPEAWENVGKAHVKDMLQNGQFSYQNFNKLYDGFFRADKNAALDGKNLIFGQPGSGGARDMLDALHNYGAFPTKGTTLGQRLDYLASKAGQQPSLSGAILESAISGGFPLKSAIAGALGSATSAAGSRNIAAPASQYVPSQAERIVGKTIQQSAPLVGAQALNPVGTAHQDRYGRKHGGRVSDKLVMAADRAKKNINSNTESLLNVPDTHVAQALELANKYL